MTVNTRFGFDEFHHPDLLEIINQNSNERTLLSATDEIFFGDNSMVTTRLCKTLNRYYWVGKACEWSRILRDARWHSSHKTINNELGYGITTKKARRILGRVSKVSDGRVIKDDSKRGVRQWRIWQPVDVDQNIDPF